MTDVQLSKIRDMAQDGRLTMKDLSHVIADFLICSENRPGGPDRHRLRSKLWYAVERLIADDPRTKCDVGHPVQMEWEHDPVPAR